MPMLERTAASLEPCHLHRVIPPTKTTFKPSRRLHTAFWQHGAADIELSNVWQALIREPIESLSFPPASQPSSSSRSESLNASSFLLDFLYPQGATSLLRRLAPSVLDKYEQPRLHLRRTLPRSFSTSASSSRQSRDSAEEPAASSATDRASAQDEATNRAEDAPDRSVDETISLAEDSLEQDAIAGIGEHVYENDGSRLERFIANALAREAVVQEAETSKVGAGPNVMNDGGEQPTGIGAQFGPSEPASLRELLDLNDNDPFGRIWSRFHSHSRAEKFRSDFMDCITKHRSMTALLAKSFNEGHWRTLWHLWARYPEAHGENVEVINWKEFKRYIQLEHLMKRLTSLIKEIHRHEKIAVPDGDLELSKTLLSSFVHPIIHRYHKKFSPEDYTHLSELLKDPLIYELFLMHTASLSRLRELSDKLYRAYRKVPGVKIRGHVMRAMVHQVYTPVRNAEGMKIVLQDLYGRFPRLDKSLYRAYINFYAQEGDVNATQHCFDEYRSHYSEQRKARPDAPRYPDFLSLLQLYAVRGELGETRRIFSQAQSDLGSKLDTRCWNVLLNAHAKAREYGAAVRVFGVLKQAVTPDHYSYGTLMGMSGSRGDLEFTLELYRMAKNEGLQPDVTMVDCVVEAYCQNDKYRDAENIVKITTERERFPKNELAIIWNSLLWHHASRRDLKTLSELLNNMTDSGIPYNDETYSHLLRALAWCKQPHHALFLLRQAVNKHAFKPTLEHFTLLMSAFMITNQPHELLRTSAILHSLGMPQTGSLLLRVLQALSAWTTQLRYSDPDKSRQYLLSALRQFRESIEQSRDSAGQKLPRQTSMTNEPWIKADPQATTVAMRTEHTNVLMHTFTLMRQATDVKGIIELWKSSSPETSNMQDPPLRLLHGLMHTAFYEGKYDEVRQTWGIIFDRANQMAHVSGPGTQRKQLLPAFRYILTDPLKTMQRLHGVTQDPDGLRETILAVLNAGFRLDSKNWNFYVQVLADLKRWREAFTVCEEQLMPYWRGWARVRAKTEGVPTNLPLDIRRRSMNPHNPRPISYTLMVLSKAYMDLEQMSSWSGEAERLMNYIVRKCPASIAAVRSAVRTDSPLEKRILNHGKPKDSKEKSDEEIREELEAQQRTREKHRRVQRRNAELSQSFKENADLPQSFKEMLEQAMGEGDTGVFHDQDWENGDEAQSGDETGGAPTADGTDASVVDVDPEVGWYDVNEQDDDEWTPLYPGSES